MVDAILHPSDGAAANEGASWDVGNVTKPSSSFSSLRSQCTSLSSNLSSLCFGFDLNWSAGTDKQRFLPMLRRYICPKLLFFCLDMQQFKDNDSECGPKGKEGCRSLLESQDVHSDFFTGVMDSNVASLLQNHIIEFFHIV